MSAPNLNAPSVVNGKTYPFAPTNTEADLIAAIATNHGFRVEAVYATNIHASTIGWVTLLHRRSGTSVEICYRLPVPLTGAFNLLGGRILYLEEADSLRVQANASSNVTVVATGEDVTL